MQLILASASPRRAELMVQAGWPFQVRPVDIEESLLDGLSVDEAIEDLALRKAKTCAAGVSEGLVIGADTVVVFNGKILGKPHSTEMAKLMLSDLRGSKHRVITGVAVVNAATGNYLVDHEETVVCFNDLSQEQIEAYVASGEPLDKAGAYGIQGKGALLVKGIEGCYSNVVGLPLPLLARMLAAAGYTDVFRFAN